MTEVAVADIAGRLSPHFRRIFHTREGSLEPRLSILDGIAARYRAPFFSALRGYATGRPGCSTRCPSSTASPSSTRTGSRHRRLLRPGHLPGPDVGHLRRPRLAARAGPDRCATPRNWRPGPSGHERPTSSPTAPRRPTRSSSRRSSTRHWNHGHHPARPAARSRRSRGVRPRMCADHGLAAPAAAAVAPRRRAGLRDRPGAGRLGRRDDLDGQRHRHASCPTRAPRAASGSAADRGAPAA